MSTIASFAVPELLGDVAPIVRVHGPFNDLREAVKVRQGHGCITCGATVPLTVEFDYSTRRFEFAHCAGCRRTWLAARRAKKAAAA